MPQEQLFKTIFGRTENDAGNKDFLKSITAQYPYFGIAQYYLLKSTEQSQADFPETSAKTALFFDPFFLNALLSAEKNTSVILPVSEYSITSPLPETTEDKLPEIQKEELKKREHDKGEPQVEFQKAEKDKAEIQKVEQDKVEPQIEESQKVEHNEAEYQKAKPDQEELLFEPLHATDYFASQGIKLSEVVLDSDKLGKQLKSFTAWLKTMKKVHPEKTAGADAAVDNAVRNLAEKSNTEEDVITEAMAEAFILQGKYQKAIVIYLKLSLLNPLKSAYFAAKIDNLKT